MKIVQSSGLARDRNLTLQWWRGGIRVVMLRGPIEPARVRPSEPASGHGGCKHRIEEPGGVIAAVEPALQGRSGRKRFMEKPRRNRQIRVNGWDIEPIGGWVTAQFGTLDDAVKRVVRAIDGAEGCLYYRSRYAVTYLTQITDGTGNALELYVKIYDPPHGLVALKQLMRGGRAANVLRMTRALQRAGFDTPPLLLQGVHVASGRTMLASARADGIPLPELIACARGDGSLARKRALLRALGGEVARLHRAGFIHGDLTPYNIFVVQSDPPRFIFLDNDRTRPGFPAGRRYRQLRNFVQLGRFDLPGLSNADRLRVFNAYAAGLGRARKREMARRVARMLARRRRRDAN